MTKKTEHSAENDPMLSSLINSKSSSVCLFGKSWDFQVDVALGISNDQNLSNISESAKHIVKSGKEFMFDAEHFFDGYKSNPEYAISCLKAAYDTELDGLFYVIQMVELFLMRYLKLLKKLLNTFLVNIWEFMLIMILKMQ